MIEFLYEATHQDRAEFLGNWCGPDTFEHSKKMLVARYQGTGDGQSVEVYCTAMPARFYALKVLPGKNSVGEDRQGYEITTGSDCQEWAAETAAMIAEGMLGFHKECTP